MTAWKGPYGGAANPPPPLPSKTDLIKALQATIIAGDELANASMPKRSSWWQRVWYGREFYAEDYDVRLTQLHHYKGRVMKAKGILRLCFPPPPPLTGPQAPSVDDDLSDVP